MIHMLMVIGVVGTQLGLSNDGRIRSLLPVDSIDGYPTRRMRIACACFL